MRPWTFSSTLASVLPGAQQLYHSTMPADSVDAEGVRAAASANVMLAVADQPATAGHPARRIVHLVNHEYDMNRTDASGINPLSNSP